MIFAFCAAIALVVVVGTAIFHYELIRRMDRFARRAVHPYPALLIVIIGLIALHLVEIGAYASTFALSVGPLALGSFHGMRRIPPWPSSIMRRRRMHLLATETSIRREIFASLRLLRP